MTDRELLELAANAAGIDAWWAEPFQFMCLRTDGNRKWNPLEDDGDALRLAVKLSITLFFYEDETSTALGGVVSKNWGSKEANTRRAIVRAAAEVGKALP